MHFESSEEVDRALSNDSVQKLLSVGLSLGKQKSYTDLCLDLKSEDSECLLNLVSSILRTLFIEAQVTPRANARKSIFGKSEQKPQFSPFDIEFLRKSVKYIQVSRFKACIYDLLGSEESAINEYLSMPFEPWNWENDFIREDWFAFAGLLNNKKWVSKRQCFLKLVERASDCFSKCSIFEINMVSEIMCQIPFTHDDMISYEHALENIVLTTKGCEPAENFILLLTKSKKFAKKYGFEDFYRRLALEEFSTRLCVANRIINLSAKEYWGPAIGHLRVCNNMVGAILRQYVCDDDLINELEKKFYWQYVQYRNLAIQTKLAVNPVKINVKFVPRYHEKVSVGKVSKEILFREFLQISPIQKTETDSGMVDVEAQMFNPLMDFNIVEGTRIAGSYKSDDTCNKTKLLEKYVVTLIAMHIGKNIISRVCKELCEEGDFFCESVESIFSKSTDAWYGRKRKQILLGIMAGFRGEFYTANMILLPLLEALVRDKLERLNESTRFIKNGREQEIVLSSLIEKDKFGECFDEDIRRNVKWLYGSSPSLNLRNVLCHGICDDYDILLADNLLCYSWWFMAMVFLRDCVHINNNAT